jgi:flagellar biosynthetic protein FliO
MLFPFKKYILTIAIMTALGLPVVAQGQLVGVSDKVISMAEAEKRLSRDNEVKDVVAEEDNASGLSLDDGLRDGLLGDIDKNSGALLPEKVSTPIASLESKRLGEIGSAMNLARQSAPNEKATGEVVEPFSMLRAVFSLVAVLALILIIAYLVRRFMPQMRTLNRRLGLEVVGRTPLGPKQSISLVKVGSKVMLVGMSPGHTTCLAMIDSPDEIALVLGQVASGYDNALESDFDETFMKEAMQYDSLDDLKDAQAMEASKELSGLMRKVKGLNKMR